MRTGASEDDKKRVTIEAWVKQVAKVLEELNARPVTPAGDLEWLLSRCDQTLGWPEHQLDWEQASARQLIKDLADFDEEFRGLLPQEVLTCSAELLEAVRER
ncbi:hypothetical protein [Hyalangium gracile]|uniref:hypothetical protein n=1 Tax=Hyalangium gracile TaxID=394092 RepID=UPI001CCE6A4F|nr:hypothetical protein [Hyalangium gracile]